MNARRQKQYADDVLATELRALVAEVDRIEAARPATMPPWDRILASMGESRKVRRRNRFRRMAAVGTALAIGVAVVGTAVGGVPKLRSSSSDPAMSPPLPTTRVSGHSQLYGTPTRGEMATNTTWMRWLQDVVSKPKKDPDPNDRITPQQVRVLYTSDTGTYRVALIEGDYVHTRRNVTTGALSSRTIPRQYWLIGATGAVPQSMRAYETKEVRDAQTLILNAGLLPIAGAVDRPAAVITVSNRASVPLGGWGGPASQALYAGSPVGTKKIEWVHGDGSVSSTAPHHLLTTIKLDDVVSVRLVDASGRQLATAGITQVSG